MISQHTLLLMVILQMIPITACTQDSESVSIPQFSLEPPIDGWTPLSELNFLFGTKVGVMSNHNRDVCCRKTTPKLEITLWAESRACGCTRQFASAAKRLALYLATQIKNRTPGLW